MLRQIALLAVVICSPIAAHAQYGTPIYLRDSHGNRFRGYVGPTVVAPQGYDGYFCAATARHKQAQQARVDAYMTQSRGSLSVIYNPNYGRRVVQKPSQLPSTTANPHAVAPAQRLTPEK